MTELSQEVSSRKPFDIDTATKLIACFTILFYIVGFITTNLYLQQLGFSDFSLFKPRFILTGSLVVTSIILNFLLIDTTKLPIQLKKTTVIGLELISKRYNQEQKLADCPSYLIK